MGHQFSVQAQLLALESRQMLSASARIWEISGDHTPWHWDDQIVISVDPLNHKMLMATVNGEVVSRRRIDSIDVIFARGGRGNDRITALLDQKLSKLRVRLDGGKGNDTLIGGAGRDELNGNSGADVLEGGQGADLLRGGAQDDKLSGADGADILEGNEGNDTLSGGWGIDRLVGGAQKDLLAGGADGDKLAGNGGNDTLIGGDGRDRLNGGAGTNTARRESSKDTIANITKSLKAARAADAALIRFADNETWIGSFIDKAVNQYNDFFGKKTDYGYPIMYFNASSGGMDLRAGTVSDATIAYTASHSDTNTQEQGVDEADMVETDGNFIYSISDRELIITDVSDPKHLGIASRTKIDGSIEGIYLNGTRVTVISQAGGYYYWDGGRPIGSIAIDVWNGGGNSAQKQQVNVTTIDVADADHPSITAEVALDGSYSSSRMIDGRLYLVVNSWLSDTGPQTVQTDDGYAYETEEAYRQRLHDSLLEELPQFNVTAGGSAQSGSLINADNLYMPESTDFATNLTTVALIDPSIGSGPISTTSVINDGTWQSYASEDAMYLTGTRWSDNKQTTSIYKFTLGTTNVTLAATGEVDGSVNNQFSMDEEDDEFRIATTLRQTQISNSVSILQQAGEDLNTLGSVKDLAPGESIFAARFIGDMAYLVTSVAMMDPLFAIDLSDPNAPVSKGELDIPGFSRYLHPIDDTHLIGLGRSGDNELQVSLFDVADASDPKRTSNLLIDTLNWNWSSAESNHLTFQYFPEFKTIAFPVYDENGERMQLVHIDESGQLKSSGEIISENNWNLRPVRISSSVFAVGTTTIDGKSLETGEAMGSVEIPQVTEE